MFNGNNGLLKINTGQEALFLLVCKKLKQQQIVHHDEAMEIYLSVVQMSEYTGWNCWDNDSGKWEWKSRLKNEWEIEGCFQAWLLRALGTLIKKGYLTVIPCIEFTKQIEN